MDLRDRQDLYNGFGNGLSRAFELAATPAVFGVLGWLLDRWAGTLPLFTLLLFFFGVAGTGYMAWFRYEQQMKEHEADAVWSRRRREGQRAA